MRALTLAQRPRRSGSGAARHPRGDECRSLREAVFGSELSSGSPTAYLSRIHAKIKQPLAQRRVTTLRRLMKQRAACLPVLILDEACAAALEKHLEDGKVALRAGGAHLIEGGVRVGRGLELGGERIDLFLLDGLQHKRPTAPVAHRGRRRVQINAPQYSFVNMQTLLSGA